MTCAMTPSSEGKPAWRAYVGSRTTRERNARGVGLSVYEVDRDGTRWRCVQIMDLVNPSFLLGDFEAGRLYAVHGDGSDISSFSIGADGRLTLLNRQPLHGRNPVHLAFSADRGRIVVANYATGSLSVLPVSGDGSLGEVQALLELPGSPGAFAAEQKGSHPHQAVRWPGTDLFIVPDKGLDRVHLVRLSDEGALELVHEAVCAPGAGPRHAAMNARTGRVWVVNELDSTLTAYRFDPAAARLQADGTVRLLPECVTVESTAAGIATVGDMLYVSNRGHDSVTAIHVEPASGALTPKQWVSTTGVTPRFLTVAPDGASLLIANEGSDAIVRCRIEQNGLLSTAEVVAKTGSPVCIVTASCHGEF